MKFLGRIINELKYGLLALFLLLFLCSGFIYAEDDLMYQVMQPALYHRTNLDLGKSVNRVGKNVFEGKVAIDLSPEGTFVQEGPSIIVKVTRLLLSLVVALSITMILYHGMRYIIQTGQGKEGKDLIKSVVYIVVGIVLSLFSVTIITLLQSVSKTFDEETQTDWSRANDGTIINNEQRYGARRSDLLGKLFGGGDA